MASRRLVILLSMPLLVCLLSPWVSARLSWILALMTLAFPWIYLATVPVALYCLGRRRWRLLALPGVGLLLGLWHFPSWLGWHDQSRGTLRILSMNCRYFDALSTSSQQVKKNIDECKPWLAPLHPDVVCAQDFSTSTSEDNERMESFVRNDMALPYFVYCMPSLASYARVPIESYHGIYFRDSYNSYCATDVRLDGRMLRIYNLHLESYQLGEDEQQGRLQRLGGSFKKLYHGIQKRSEQAELVAQSIATSPYPVVVCGDFNDVPTSYAYHTVLGPLQDGFRQAGHGLAITYKGKIPGLRIDYMFCSKELRFTSYRHIRGPEFLDHCWVLGDLIWRT